MKFILLYVFVIFATNLGFSYIPPIDIGFGLFSPVAVVVGGVFVARDYAQRHAGNYVLLAMLFGCGLSYLMADPFVAIASVASFAASEIVDWLAFTLSKKPFYERVMISSIISTPVDTLIFLSIVGLLSPATFAIMVASKLLVAFGIFYYGKKKRMA